MSPEVPITCPYCGLSFGTGISMTRSTNIVIGGYSTSCPRCGRTVTRGATSYSTASVRGLVGEVIVRRDLTAAEARRIWADLDAARRRGATRDEIVELVATAPESVRAMVDQLPASGPSFVEKLALIIAVLSLLADLIGAGVGTWSALRPQPAPTPRTTPRAPTVSDDELDRLTAEVLERLARAPGADDLSGEPEAQRDSGQESGGDVPAVAEEDGAGESGDGPEEP